MPENLINELAAEASVNWQFKLAITLVMLLVSLLVKWITVRVIRKRVRDPTVRLVWTQIANGTILLVLVVLLSWIWLQGVGSILALLTLVAAAMTIVHKELIQNFTSWSVIAWRGLFQLGDHIEIGAHTGEVVDIGPMYFTINEATGIETGLRPTGRTIRIPNGQVLTSPVVNFSDQHIRWSDVEFAVGTDDDWETARSIVEQVIREESETSMIDTSKATDLTVTVHLAGAKVVLTAHYPTRPSDRLSAQTRVTARILNRFKEAGITPA